MRWLLLFVALLAVMAALVPMRIVAPRLVPGLTADRIEGGIWDAHFTNVHYQGMGLGDLDARLHWQALLNGEAALILSRPEPPLVARIGGGKGRRLISDVTGRFDLALLPAPLPPVSLGFDKMSLAFTPDRRCVIAAGMVTANLATIPFVGDSPVLSGRPLCHEGSLRLPLRSAGGQFGLDLAHFPDGRWTASLQVVPPGPLARAALLAGGFTNHGDAMRLSVTGLIGQRGMTISQPG